MSAVPLHAKQPEDRKSPAKREADGDDTATMQWRGHTVTVPATADDWDADATEAIELGRAITGIRGLLGSKQYDAIRKAEKADGGWRNRDAADLLNAILREVYGFEEGE